MKKNVQLGDMYRDTITGFTGVAVARHEYLNGCVRITLQCRDLQEGKPVDGHAFDVEQIERLDSAGVAVTKRDTGGPGDVPPARHIPRR